jgi:hypothetical protein
MSQIASEIRTLVASRKGLQDTVGICDDFQVGKKAISLKSHLNTFTQDDKPLLGNSAHQKLLFDECEQLILPLEFADYSAVAVIKLSVKEDKRKAFIQYFDSKGTDLSDDLLVSLSAFFTENNYEVLYHCVSEPIVKKGIAATKIICFKAIDLANQNAGLSENLSATLIESNEPDSKEKNPNNPVTAVDNPAENSFWLILLLAVGFTLYLGFDYVKPYTVALMGLVPANPILAYITFGGVFCLGWLILALLQHISREREIPVVKSTEPRQVIDGGIIEILTPQKGLLSGYESAASKEPAANNEALNKEATASMRSLRLN